VLYRRLFVTLVHIMFFILKDRTCEGCNFHWFKCSPLRQCGSFCGFSETVGVLYLTSASVFCLSHWAIFFPASVHRLFNTRFGNVSS